MHRTSKASGLLILAAALLAGRAALAGEAAAESAPPKSQAEPGPGPVFVLKLTDEEGGGAISFWNLAYMKRCLERARREKAALFVLELTTGGGRGDIMKKMGEALAGFKAARTATFVNEQAMSAGAFLALACDDIYMRSSSQLGAATPWLPSPQGGVATLPSKVEEKFIRSATVEFRSMAERKGHNGALAAAMVDPEIEVVAVRDGRKLVPMTREEFAAARKKAGGRRLAEEEVIVKKGNILVFNTRQAVKWGLARAEVADHDALLKHAGLSGRPVVKLVPSWGEKLARFCSGGVVAALLIGIAILALYTEMQKPTGIGAAIFLTALVTFFWANYLAGSAGPLSIIIFLVGLVLLLAEIFFIPGFGVAGISGIVLMLVGMVAARIPAGFFTPAKGIDLPSLRWTDFGLGAFPVIMGVGLSTAGVLVMMRFLPSLPIFKRLVLKADMGGAVVSAAQAAGAESAESLVGLTGVTATKLRPGGSARFGGKLLDVVSDGEFLEAGAPVKIVSASGNRIVVRRA